MKPSQLAKLKKSDPEKYHDFMQSGFKAEVSPPEKVQRSFKTPAMLAMEKKGVASIDSLSAESDDSEGGVGESPAPVLETISNPSGAYSLALTALEQDKKQLKGKPLAEKEAYKREAVPRYMEYLTAYIESGSRYYNEVLVTLGLWLIDIQNVERGIELLDYAIAQQQPAPKNFTRTLDEIVAEQVADWGTAQNKLNQSASPYLEIVAEKVHSKSYQVSNIVIESKLFRQAAINAMLTDDLELAVKWYERCIAANPEKHGVKTKYEQVKARLEKKTKTPDQD